MHQYSNVALFIFEDIGIECRLIYLGVIVSTDCERIWGAKHTLNHWHTYVCHGSITANSVLRHLIEWKIIPTPFAFETWISHAHYMSSVTLISSWKERKANKHRPFGHIKYLYRINNLNIFCWQEWIAKKRQNYTWKRRKRRSKSSVWKAEV